MKAIHINQKPESGAVISVVHPVPGLTEEEQHAAFLRSVPDGVPFIIVPDDYIPTDREFRNAWRCDLSTPHGTGRGTVVPGTPKPLTVDFPHAQELTRERLRREREPLLAAQDVAYMQALEANDRAEQARIAAEKQRLRDVTLTVDTATTLDQLKALHP